MVELSQIDKNNLPKHIAIIMDGNGRWAKKIGEQRTVGHQSGVNSVREVVEACTELGIDHLTLYAFSTENWNRPIEEVNALMGILVDSILKEVPTMMKNGIRLTTIGDTSSLPESCRHTLLEAITLTKNNPNLNLNLALSYSGKWDITQAVKQIVKDSLANKLNPEDINQDLISNYLATKDMPDPEIMIRTSGEFRISNFLLWQLAYTEIFISPVLWPEFRKENLYEILLDFQQRERRFGKTGDQIKAEKA